MVRAICTTVYLALQLVKGIEDDVAESSLIHFRSKDNEHLALEEAVEATASCKLEDFAGKEFSVTQTSTLHGSGSVYTYDIVIGGKIVQKTNNAGTYLIGKHLSYGEKTEQFGNGDKCGSTPRKAKITFKFGSELKLLKAAEPSSCVYEYEVQLLQSECNAKAGGTIPLSGGNDASAKNLQRCTGECDDDAQCAAGLVCFQRENGESIPGCSGPGGGKNWDYCYDPNGIVELSGGNDASATNLQRCTGECDADSQCSMGLKCFQRQNGEHIPGCTGPGGGKDWDYCYRPDGVIALTGGNDASAKNLQACTGECDADSQCASGLKCLQRENGETIPGCSGPGGGKNWDYCYDPNHDPSKDPGTCKGFEWAPANGNIGDCGAQLKSGDSCKPGCNAGYTLKGVTSCKDGKVTAATCQEMACEKIEAPSNGNKGDCGSTLDSGAKCKPACNAGYTLEGITSCNKGALSAATCEEKSCTGLTAPANGAMGNCPTTLGGGDSCSPSCNLYFEAKKPTSCSKGKLTAATCTTIFDCNAGLKYWNIGWSDAKKDLCCKKEEFCKEPCSLVSNKKVTGKETGSCFKKVTGLSESDCKFHCRQAKYVALCEVWMYQKSGSVCKHWGQCADQKLGATASGFTSGVCEVPPLPCSVKAPSNGNDGDCGKTLGSGESCKPGCNAGYTLSGTSSCSDGVLKTAKCTESPCKVTAPANGGMGKCGASLASGKSCEPTCKTGYTLVGKSTCSKGSLTAAKCKESDCDVADPADGGPGNCPKVLKSGDSCSPSCELYYTLSGETSCLKGKLTAATCPTIFDCNAGIKNWKAGWSSVKQTACCNKNGVVCK